MKAVDWTPNIKACLPQTCGNWLNLGETESIIDPENRLPTKNE